MLTKCSYCQVKTVLQRKKAVDQVGPILQFTDMCPVCHDPYEAPIMHTTCGNMFCKDCVGKETRCPACRAEDLHKHVVPAPKLVLSQLDAILVCCNTCNHTCPRGQIRHHIASQHPSASLSSSAQDQVIAALQKRVAALELRLSNTSSPASIPSLALKPAVRRHQVRLDGIYLADNNAWLLFSEDLVQISHHVIKTVLCNKRHIDRHAKAQ